MVIDHVEGQKTVPCTAAWSHHSGLESSLDRLYGTPSIIVDYHDSENECLVKGISIGALLDNVHGLRTSDVWNGKYNTPRRHLKWFRMSVYLERVCASAVVIYPIDGKFRLGCRCCGNDIHVPDEGSYSTIHEAMEYIPGASLTHRLLNHLVREFPNPSGDFQSASTTNFPYRIDRRDLHLMYNKSITACTPDPNKHDSCLGDNQLILSTILSADPHYDVWQMGMWTDIIKSVFNGTKAKIFMISWRESQR